MAYIYVKPSTVHVPASGGTAPAAWGTAVNTALSVLAPSVAILRRAAAQSVNDSSAAQISFDTEDIDDSGFWAAGSPTRIAFPVKGIYLIDVEVQFASDADGIRQAALKRSGGSNDFNMVAPAINGVATVVKYPFITAERAITDYYELEVIHNAGGALNVTARVAITLLQERS